jgi:hypothetical protein
MSNTKNEGKKDIFFKYLQMHNDMSIFFLHIIMMSLFPSYSSPSFARSVDFVIVGFLLTTTTSAAATATATTAACVNQNLVLHVSVGHALHVDRARQSHRRGDVARLQDPVRPAGLLQVPLQDGGQGVRHGEGRGKSSFSFTKHCISFFIRFITRRCRHLSQHTDMLQ